MWQEGPGLGSTAYFTQQMCLHGASLIIAHRRAFMETADRSHRSLITAVAPLTCGGEEGGVGRGGLLVGSSGVGGASLVNNLVCSSYHISDKGRAEVR